MSCDFGIWYPHKRLNNNDAGELYTKLCDGEKTSLKSHPNIDKFYSDLTSIYPETDDSRPWSYEIEHTPNYVIASCVWSRVEEVEKIINETAFKYGLAVYDPQSKKIYYSDGTIGNNESVANPFLPDLLDFLLFFPVLLLCIAPMWLIGYLVENGVISRTYNWLGLVLMAIGFIVMWILNSRLKNWRQKLINKLLKSTK